MRLGNSANILVIRTDRIGDVVLTSPVFKALRVAYPNARISVMVTPAARELVDGNPYIDEVMVDDRMGAHRGVIGALQLARSIRRRHFDIAFIYHTKRRYNLAAYLAGVPYRVGYKNDKWGWLLNVSVKDERAKGHKHEVRYCLDLLHTVGIDHTTPELFVPAAKEHEAWALKWFAQHGLTAGEAIAVHPGASDPTKIWPQESFVQLISALRKRYPYQVVIIGGKETMPIAERIKGALKQEGVHDLCGQAGLGQTAALLRRCRLLVSNDSGPVHIGAAVGIPVISLFLRDQPGINPQRWAPYGPNGYVLSNKPNEIVKVDARSKMQSGKLDSITPQEVLDLINRILSGEHQTVFYW